MLRAVNVAKSPDTAQANSLRYMDFIESVFALGERRSALKGIVIAVGSSGDVHPLLGIAQTLQARGQEILFATNGHFEPLAQKSGAGV